MVMGAPRGCKGKEIGKTLAAIGYFRSVTPHTRIVVSSLPEASQRPSGENASAVTGRACPEKRRRLWPVTSSHISTSFPPLSRLPAASIFPSREKARAPPLPHEVNRIAPLNSRYRLPFCSDQTRTVLSDVLPEAK